MILHGKRCGSLIEIMKETFHVALFSCRTFNIARILIVMLGDVIVVKFPSLLKKFARMANAIFSFFLLDEKIFPSLNKTMTTGHWHPDPISTFMRV